MAGQNKENKISRRTFLLAAGATTALVVEAGIARRFLFIRKELDHYPELGDKLLLEELAVQTGTKTTVIKNFSNRNVNREAVEEIFRFASELTQQQTSVNYNCDGTNYALNLDDRRESENIMYLVEKDTQHPTWYATNSTSGTYSVFSGRKNHPVLSRVEVFENDNDIGSKLGIVVEACQSMVEVTHPALNNLDVQEAFCNSMGMATIEKQKGQTLDQFIQKYDELKFPSDNNPLSRNMPVFIPSEKLWESIPVTEPVLQTSS